MTWRIEFDHYAAKEFKKLDKTSQNLITDYLKNKVIKSDNPKALGKAMKFGYAGLWRYRVGKYRIICNLEAHKLVVLVLRVAPRDKIYKQGEI